MPRGERVAAARQPLRRRPSAASSVSRGGASGSAAAALVAIVLMPQPDGLSVAGQHMLGIFVFAVIVWMTEAVEYAASSIMVMALIAFLLGIAPDPAHPDTNRYQRGAVGGARRLHQHRGGADRGVARDRRRHGGHRAR